MGLTTHKKPKKNYIKPLQVVFNLVCPDIILCSVQEFDSGSYFCRASNIHLQRFLTSRRAALTVQGTTLH